MGRSVLNLNTSKGKISPMSGLDSIPLYLVLNSTTATICIFWISKRLKKSLIDESLVYTLTAVLLVCGFIGARLTHIIIEEPVWYIQNPLQVIAIWKGGFVLYGGIIGGLLGALVFLRKKNLLHRFFLIADFYTPVISLGLLLGRISCLMAGCCYGKYCDLPWAIGHRHPTQVYLMIAESIALTTSLILEKKKNLAPGSIFFWWIGLHSLGRFIIEFFRDDDRGPMFLISPSGWISLFVLAFIFVKLIRQK